MQTAGTASRSAPPRPDRRPLARRSAHPRSARARRSGSLTTAAARFSYDTTRAADAAKPAWWEQPQPWLEIRLDLRVGPLFCVVNGPTRGRHWSSAAARAALRRTAADAGVRRRFAPHPLRHAPAVEMGPRRCAADRHPPPARHSNFGITSIYLQGIDNAEIDTVYARHAPMSRVSTVPTALIPSGRSCGGVAPSEAALSRGARSTLRSCPLPECAVLPPTRSLWARPPATDNDGAFSPMPYGEDPRSVAAVR
jgi:integrase/recombinase XerD